MTPGRILGVDHGERRTGLAVSDPLGIAARPLREVRAADAAAMVEAVARVAREEGVERVVVGYPRNMDGTEGPRARAVARFVHALAVALAPVPVETVDERLSTQEARTRLRRRGRRGRLTKTEINLQAARILLQSYLDARREDASGPGACRS